MRSKAEMMAEIIYITVTFFGKMREDRSFENTRNLIQHTHIYNLESCLESGIPTLSSYVRVNSQQRDMMIVSADKHNAGTCVIIRSF